jgi:hypothetical protein
MISRGWSLFFTGMPLFLFSIIAEEQTVINTSAIVANAEAKLILKFSLLLKAFHIGLCG